MVLAKTNEKALYIGPSSVRSIPLVIPVAHQTPVVKTVKEINSKEEFQATLHSAGKKIVGADFSATWCGSCKMIKPFSRSLCEKYGNVVLLEVDVDDCQDVASECEVKCMPTFQFYERRPKVGKFSGANKENLEATINKLIMLPENITSQQLWKPFFYLRKRRIKFKKRVRDIKRLAQNQSANKFQNFMYLNAGSSTCKYFFGKYFYHYS
ncbi:uncharacterized protein LOC142440145 [Tenrec ecaudatus]|uniref:uncharacterized protein LOC142440145 n=1 Tax=Tenrec ecaudatus TaxID=94439 RepID=UPI003F5A802F